jgi:hypothetical protein
VKPPVEPEAPPPPAPELLEAVGRMQPVRTRVPWRVLALALVGALAWGAVFVFVMPLRVDLPHLPRGHLILTLVAWALGFVAPLALALVPPRGQVSPSGLRALGAALAGFALVAPLAFLFPPVAPGHTLTLVGARQNAAQINECVRFSFGVWLGVALVGFAALRQVVVAAPWQLGAAAGAAGGALGGLVLVFLCPYGSPLHDGVAHALPVALWAGLGAAVLGRLLRR